ncbi:MAG: hypothetical protein JWM41_307 [Gemmatimonadetes bacterium]|nr:hypothetical protein [Gemmatimonadota bacterium]
MRTPTLFAAAALFAVAACSGDSAASTDPTATGTTSTGVTIFADTTLKTDSVVAGSAIPIRVHIVQNGVPIANVLVVWSVTSGGGSVPAASSVTDSTGVAAITWTVGDTLGANALTASIAGASIVVTATTIAGPVSTLVKVSADSDAVVASASLALTVRTVDRFGNGVAGVTVNWASSGGSLTAASTVSGPNGNATANFTSDARPATYSVTAAVPGRASVTFRVIGL